MDSTFNDMGWCYIAEQTTPDDMKITNLKVQEKAGDTFFVEFDSGLHSFEVINRNERQYLGSNIKECLQSERIQSQLRDNAWYGEQDHPMQMIEGQKLTPQRVQNVYMPNRSHKIMNPRFEGNMLYGHIQTSSNDVGRDFAREIIQGLHPSFSCRAIAALRLIDGKPTVMCRKVVTYDWVLFPSHKEATIVSMPKGVVKSIETVTESVKDNVGKITTALKKKSKDILMPLKDFLEDMAETDVNTNLIMEAFDLNKEDLVDIDDSHTHIVMRDGDNLLYSKISGSSVRKVKDFYSSFDL